MSGNNLEVKITADSSSLVAASAVAKAQVQSLATAMSAAAKQTLVDPTAIAKVQELASALVPAKTHLAELSEQMKNTRTASGGLGSAIEEARAGLSRVFQVTGIAAAAEGVMKLGEAIENLGARALEMRSLSEVLGGSTSQLQAMQVAAEEGGTSMEVLARASEKFTVALSEARNGSGKAIELLHSLGVSTQEIADPTFQLNQLLGVLKSRLADVSSAESTRKALLQELGARTALAIEAIKEYDGSQQGVAEAMRRINGLSDDQIEQLQKTKTNWSELGTEIENWASKAMATAARVLPSLKDIATTFTNGAIGGASEPSGPGRSASSTGEQQAAAESARQQEALHNEVLRSEMESIRSGVAAFGEGTAQRLAALQRYAGLAKQYYGGDNVDEVRKANSEVLAAQREFQDTQGREQIAAARAQVTEILAETTKGAIQRLVEEAGVWQKLLDGDKLNKDQRVEVERALAADVASIARQSAAEQAAIIRINANSDMTISRMQIAAAKETANAQVAATKAAVAAKYEALETLTDQEFALDLEALNNELSTLKEATPEYARVYDEIRELKARLVTDLAKFDRLEAEDAKHAANQQASDWDKAVGEIENAESGMVSDILNKRKSLAQSLKAIGADLVTQEITNDLKAATASALASQEGADQKKAIEQGGFLFHEMMELKSMLATARSQQGQVQAVDAGNAQKTASTDSAAAAAKGAGAAQGGASVMADAAKAFSGTYASVAQIPYVGWILAPAAAAAAFAAVAAYEGLASLDVGTNYVPGDMLAQIHEGEAVIPKRYNPAANGGGGSGGGIGGTIHNYGDIHMTDTNLKRLLSSRGAQRQVMDALAGAYRRGARLR